MKTADRTIVKNLGFCSFGLSSNATSVDVKDGKIVRIRPLHYDENYTKEALNSWKMEKNGHVFEPGFKTLPPPISLAYKKRTTSPNRVPYPLKRVDWDPDGERNPQNRGTSKYERISWDDATAIIAREIKRIHDEYGPYSIYCTGDGHGESKNYGGAHGCNISMFQLLDGCTVQARQPDSWEGWYWGAKHMWGMEPVGTNVYQNGVLRDITENGDAILYWGCDPETTPWGWGGQQASRMCFWFDEIGVKSIYISPDANYGCVVHADKWIPILPNTDSALQLAIAYVWLTEGTYDKGYLDTHAVGFDWFQSYVMGWLDDKTPKTPRWAAEKCGVPSYRIKALARYWAAHRVSIAHINGGGFIRSAFSHEPARLEVALLGMQAIGKPGAHQFKFAEWSMMGQISNVPVPVCEVYPNTEGTYHGWNSQLGPSIIAKTKLHEAILNPPVDWYGHVQCSQLSPDQFLHFEYPLAGAERIHMIWTDLPCLSTCWNGGAKFQDAFKHESIEFFLVQHPWMENDTMFADIILPVATTFECGDFGTDTYGGQFNLMFFEDQAIGPVGEAKSDYDTVGEVAKALESFGGKYEGLHERYTGGMDFEQWMHRGYELSGAADRISYEQLKKQKFWASPIKKGWEDEPAGLKGFHDDPHAHPLQTASGKIEYYSATLAAGFPDDKVRAPYPQWIEETEEHKDRISSDRAKDYPFLMVSNHPRWRIHANHDDIPWLREIDSVKIEGPDGYKYESLWINPQDAERIGLEDGDIAKIYNERGGVLGGIVLSERVMPGTLYQEHGARVDSIVNGTGGLDRGGANNLICPSATTSENCAGEVTSSFLVGIEKVDVIELAQEYPRAFSRDYDPDVGLIASAYITEERQHV